LSFFVQGLPGLETILRMSAELVYYGKFADLAYLDSIPWNQFNFYHKWLHNVKKEEAAAREKAQKSQEQAMSSAKRRTR
jgi:hypothetical protein